MSSKFNYRVWQFRKSLGGSPTPDDWKIIESYLTPQELKLFTQLAVPDQNHSLRVLKVLYKQGEDDPDLLKAALLHDIGKTRYPLRRWERVFAVLLMGLFPKRVKVWGGGKPTGLRRPLVVIQQHPIWGAEIAQEVGCSQRTIWLIKNHEMKNPEGSTQVLDLSLLKKLQEADNLN